MIRVSVWVRVIRTGTRNDRFRGMKSIRFPCRRTGVGNDGFRGLDGWQELGAVPGRKGGIESRKWVAEHGVHRQGDRICGQHLQKSQNVGKTERGRKEGGRKGRNEAQGACIYGQNKEGGYFGPITLVYCLGGESRVNSVRLCVQGNSFLSQVEVALSF